MNKLVLLSDNDVQSQLATKYNLLVHIGLETLQYAIIDHSRNQVKVLAEYEMAKTSSVNEIIDALELLPEYNREFKFSYNKVKVSFDASDSTIIPVDLYDENTKRDYEKFFNQTGHKDIIVNDMASGAMKNIVAIDEDLNSALHNIFQKPQIFNQATSFLEGIQKNSSKELGLECFIDIQPKQFQLGLLKDSRLEFYSSFEYANADEFNYYLLNIIESLNLSDEQIPVVLSGKIATTDEVYLRIQKYFDTIRFIDSPYLKKYSENFEELLPHSFFSLFSLDLCE